ncbi:MAG: hypothetical protein KA116_04000 [Proteobacteria bacterium]|nr:hypothetical protein [Pseudomonadota bacterium]
MKLKITLLLFIGGLSLYGVYQWGYSRGVDSIKITSSASELDNFESNAKLIEPMPQSSVSSNLRNESSENKFASLHNNDFLKEFINSGAIFKPFDSSPHIYSLNAEFIKRVKNFSKAEFSKLYSAHPARAISEAQILSNKQKEWVQDFILNDIQSSENPNETLLKFKSDLSNLGPTKLNLISDILNNQNINLDEKGFFLEKSIFSWIHEKIDPQPILNILYKFDDEYERESLFVKYMEKASVFDPLTAFESLENYQSHFKLNKYPLGEALGSIAMWMAEKNPSQLSNWLNTELKNYPNNKEDVLIPISIGLSQLKNDEAIQSILKVEDPKMKIDILHQLAFALIRFKSKNQSEDFYQELARYPDLANALSAKLDSNRSPSSTR